MDDTLGMNDHLYLLRFHIEQPFGLDHLQAFVHECGRIDRDFGAHRPVGMLKRMFSFYIDEIIWLAAQERTTGSSQYEDRKSTRLNCSHGFISYAVFCL